MKVTLEIDDAYAGALSVTAVKSDVFETRVSVSVISLSACNSVTLKADGTWVKHMEKVKDGK